MKPLARKPVSVSKPLMEGFGNPDDIVLYAFCDFGSTLVLRAYWVGRWLIFKFLGNDVAGRSAFEDRFHVRDEDLRA